MNDFEYGFDYKRPRGKDKAKDRYNRNGGFSQKHLRIKADEKLRSNNKSNK